jgi:hypothetical protein
MTQKKAGQPKKGVNKLIQTQFRVHPKRKDKFRAKVNEFIKEFQKII